MVPEVPEISDSPKRNAVKQSPLSTRSIFSNSNESTPKKPLLRRSTILFGKNSKIDSKILTKVGEAIEKAKEESKL